MRKLLVGVIICMRIQSWVFDVHETAAFVTERLRGMGINDITNGIGQTGVVAVIKGCKDTKGRVVGLRADMDALPILELVG